MIVDQTDGWGYETGFFKFHVLSKFVYSLLIEGHKQDREETWTYNSRF